MPYFVEIEWGGTEYEAGKIEKVFTDKIDALDFMDTCLATSVAELDYNNITRRTIRHSKDEYLIATKRFSFWESGCIIEL